MKARMLSAAAIAAVLVPLTASSADATEPSLSINDVTIQEPSYGTTTATFTVSLSNPSAEDVSVGYRINNNNSGVQEFYSNLTIRAGESAGSIPVTVPYQKYSGDTSFTVRLTLPTGATIADELGVGTVRNTTPKGSFVCQAMQRNGAAGTGETAGSPDGECAWYRKEWDNGGHIVTDYTRMGPPTSAARVTDANTAYLIETRYVPPPLHSEIWVGWSKAISGVRVSCGAEEQYGSSVAGLGVWIRGGYDDQTLFVDRKDITEYRSIPLANGWRLELNVTDIVGSGDVKFVRQTAVRLTAPNGLTTSFAVAEVGPEGDPCS